MTAFEEMGVLPEIAKAVEEMDWTLPTDVQAEAVPLILGGGDTLMAAETGSGKTGAFCLPILQIVWETLRDRLDGKGTKGGSAPISTKWAISMYDRDSKFAVSADGYTCQSRDQRAWQGGRATKGVHGSGKYYYEAKVTDEGLCRVGWSTSAAVLDLGTDKQGYGFGGTGKKSFARQFDEYGEPFGINDVIGCYLDLDNFVIRYSKNGVDLGKAFDIQHNLRTCPFFPAVVLKNAEMQFNFGSTPFRYPPSEGFVGICNAPKNNVVDNPSSGVAASPSLQKFQPNAPQAVIIEVLFATRTACAVQRTSQCFRVLNKKKVNRLWMQPSRELAEQTLQCITKFKRYLKDPIVRELLVIGGVSAKDQMQQLQDGVDIVVATPGRLEDMISTGQLSLAQCRFFVLDEADGLLKQGNGDLINRLHAKMPKITPDGKRLQMVVCSATLHSFEVKQLAERLMHFPTWIDLKGEDSVPDTVHHVVCMVDPRKDLSWQRLKRHVATDGVHHQDNLRGNTPESLSEAVKFLKGEYCVRVIQKQKMDQGIIFCRTKVDCDNLESYFESLGGGPRAGKESQFSCVCLHGDRKPPERKANLDAFKAGRVRFLICTDVAARGIDVSKVPFVINVTLPDEKANYVHRIGRVGRADRMGLAVSLVSAVPEKVWYHSNCQSRGKGCYNTNLTDRGGCCIWYNEPQLLADVEEHLNCTITQVEPDLEIPADEFDGKVVYGQKRQMQGSSYKTHVDQMAPLVSELATMEKNIQNNFLKLYKLQNLGFQKA